MGGDGSFRVDLHKERRNNYGHPRFIADYYYEAQIHIQIYNILKIGHYATFLVRTISITNKKYSFINPEVWFTKLTRSSDAYMRQ